VLCRQYQRSQRGEWYIIGYTWEDYSLGVILKNPCKSLTYKGFKMARLERLCGTSLCRTPAGGLQPSSGPLAALASKITPGDFVKLGVLI